MSTKEPIDRFERIEAEIIVLTDRVATIENKKILWIEAAEKVAQAAGRQPGETLSEAVCRVTKERDEAAQKVTAAREKHVKLVAELERLASERDKWQAKADAYANALKDVCHDLHDDRACLPECDSHGHSGDCPDTDTIAAVKLLRKERDELSEWAAAVWAYQLPIARGTSGWKACERLKDSMPAAVRERLK